MTSLPHVVCVMDHGLHWEARVTNLLRSLRWFGGALSRQPFTALSVGTVGDGFRARMDELGGVVRSVEPALRTRPFMNKLRGLDEDFGADLLLLDCDVVVVGDLLGLVGTSDVVRAKPADVSPFSAAEWEALDFAVGPIRPGSMRTTTTGQPTGVYVNSGVLVVGRDTRAPLVAEWPAKFALADPVVTEIRPSKAFFAEQVALGAAIVSTGIPLVPLPVAFNWPAHLEADVRPGSQAVPHLIHYHNMCIGPLVLAPLAPPSVQRRLEALAAKADGDLVAPGGPGARTAAEVRSISTRLRARTGQT